MESTVKKKQLACFVAGFQWKPAPKPQLATVEDFMRQIRRQANHEIYRTCNVCQEEFDVRKTLEFKCPKCGSTDLNI